jgi:hypothetical protein
MAELVAVLKQFYSATQCFQDTTSVVISLVFPTILNIVKTLRSETHEYEVRLPAGVTT